MKYFAVIANPTAGLVSVARQLNSPDDELNEGEALMDETAYNAWLEQPAQVNKASDIQAQIDAEAEAASEQLAQETEDKKIDEVARLLNVSREVAAAIYENAQGGGM